MSETQLNTVRGAIINSINDCKSTLTNLERSIKIHEKNKEIAEIKLVEQQYALDNLERLLKITE